MPRKIPGFAYPSSVCPARAVRGAVVDVISDFVVQDDVFEGVVVVFMRVRYEQDIDDMAPVGVRREEGVEGVGDRTSVFGVLGGVDENGAAREFEEGGVGLADVEVMRDHRWGASCDQVLSERDKSN